MLQLLCFRDRPAEHDGRLLTLVVSLLVKRPASGALQGFSVLRTAGVLCECLTNIWPLFLAVRCAQVHFDGSGLNDLASRTRSSQLFLRWVTI